MTGVATGRSRRIRDGSVGSRSAFLLLIWNIHRRPRRASSEREDRMSRNDRLFGFTRMFQGRRLCPSTQGLLLRFRL